MNEYELYHYGIKGQKWGVRRYQNKDGTLTPAGKKRNNEESKTKLNKDDIRELARIGGSICAGYLSGKLGSVAIFELTGSSGLAVALAPSMAILGYAKYYDFIGDRNDS